MYWWRVISAATKWGAFHQLMWNQTETAVVHYTSHHCVTPHGGQSERLWREKASLTAQYGTLDFEYNTKTKQKRKEPRKKSFQKVIKTDRSALRISLHQLVVYRSVRRPELWPKPPLLPWGGKGTIGLVITGDSCRTRVFQSTATQRVN